MNHARILAGALIAVLVTFLTIPVLAAPSDAVAELQANIRQARALMVQIRVAVQSRDWEALRGHLNAYTATMRDLNAQLSRVQQQQVDGGLTEALEIEAALARLYDELTDACGTAGASGGGASAGGCDTAMSVAYHGLGVAYEVVQKQGAPEKPAPSIPGPGAP